MRLDWNSMKTLKKKFQKQTFIAQVVIKFGIVIGMKE